MLILVGVTVTVSLNGGLFSSAQEAKFKTEVRQYQECVEYQKAAVLADNNGMIPEDFTDYGLTDTVPENLKEKYQTKLEVLYDGELYYTAKNLTEKEIQWCEELGITGNPSIREFMANRAKANFDEDYIWIDGEETTGIIDLEAVKSDLKKRYPDAVFSYFMISGSNNNPAVYALSSNEYKEVKKVIEDIDKLYYYLKNINKTQILESDIEDDEILEIAKKQISFPYDKSKLGLLQIGKVLYLGTINLNVFYNNEHLHMLPMIQQQTEEIEEVFNNLNIEMMSKEDAEKMLEFEEEIYSNNSKLLLGGIVPNGTYLKVVGYKTANPTVPGYIITSDNELEAVEEIAENAFATGGKVLKADCITIRGIEKEFGKAYENITFDEIKEYILAMAEDEGGTFQSDLEAIVDKYTTSNNESRDNLFMEFLGYGFEISGDLTNYLIRENNRIYAFLENGEITTFKDESGNTKEYLEAIGNINILEGVRIIGANAFAGNSISYMYFPTTIEYATNALKDAEIGDHAIKTRLTGEEMKDIEGYNNGWEPFGYSHEGWNNISEIIE